MNTKQLQLAFLWAMGGFSGLFAEEIRAELADYGGAYELTVPSGSLSAQVGVPVEAYSRMAPDAEQPNVDLFTPTGENLPWRLVERRLPASESLWVDLPLALVAQNSLSQGPLASVDLEASGGAVAVRWRTAGGFVDRDSVWWIDVRGRRLAALRLRVPDSVSFVGAARLEASEDLLHWRTLLTGQGVAAWNDGDLQVRSLQIPVDDSTAFLRLTLLPEQGKSGLSGVQGLSLRAVRESALIPALLSAGSFDSTGWVYRCTGPWPVRAVRLETMSEGTWGAGELQMREHDTLPWMPVAEMSGYQWRSGSRLFQADSITWGSPLRAIAWRFVPRTPRAALGPEAPRLRIWWSPDSLQFVAGGRARVWLAVGLHPSRQGERQSLEDSLPGATVLAKVGAYNEQAGALALEPEAGWDRRIFLWAGLLVFLVLLAGMSWRLWREMSGSPK